MTFIGIPTLPPWFASTPQPRATWPPPPHPALRTLQEQCGCATCGTPIVHHEHAWWHDPNRHGHTTALVWDRLAGTIDAHHLAHPQPLEELAGAEIEMEDGRW